MIENKKIPFFINSLVDPEKNSEMIHQLINDNYPFVEYNSWERFIYSGWGLLLSIITVIPFLFVAIARKKRIKRDFGSLENSCQSIYTAWFENHYSDITNSKHNNLPELRACASQYRGASNVPSDARIYNTQIGPTLNYKNATLQSICITWHWTRTTGSGKNRTTTNYYREVFYALVENLPKNWDSLQFVLTPSGLLNKKKTLLENDDFNKKWKYNCNNPQQFLKLMSLSTQENIINNWSSKFEMRKISNKMIASERSIDSPFSANLPWSINFTNRQKVTNYLSKNIIKDLTVFQKFVAEILTLKYLYR